MPNPQTPHESQGQISFEDDTPLKFDTPADLLLFLGRLPINRDVEPTSLPPFLRRFRTNAHLNIDDVATALEITTEALTEFESSEILPWELESSVMAKLANAYRIHIEAIDFLTQNSYQIAKLSKALKEPDQVRSSMLKWLGNVRSEMEASASADLTT